MAAGLKVVLRGCVVGGAAEETVRVSCKLEMILETLILRPLSSWIELIAGRGSTIFERIESSKMCRTHATQSFHIRVQPLGHVLTTSDGRPDSLAVVNHWRHLGNGRRMGSDRGAGGEVDK